MGFKQFYLAESESPLIIEKDDYHWFNVDDTPKAKLKEIYSKIKKLGYDVRNMEDLVSLIKKINFIIGGDETKFYKLVNSQWQKIIIEVLGKEKKHREQKTDLLSTVLKNIKKDKESGITVGTIINSTTGYILPDGRVLNLGGGMTRANDHRIINHYFEDEFSSQSSKMAYFLEHTGVIRYIPESIGFDIAKEPTRKQLVQIGNAILKNPSKEISLDLKSDKFNKKGKLYKPGTKPAIVIRDIQTYYNDGTIRNTEFFEN